MFSCCLTEDTYCIFTPVGRWANAFLVLQVSEVSIQLYSLVHWEDPMDLPQVGSPSSGVPSCTKEGTLLYRAGTTYLGKELWKSCYLVLRFGQIKYVSTPQLVSTCSFNWLVSIKHTAHLTLTHPHCLLPTWRWISSSQKHVLYVPFAVFIEYKTDTNHCSPKNCFRV